MYSATKAKNMYEGNSIHLNSLEVGHEFQDFIVERLTLDMGISISLYQSKKYQFGKGESLQGVEIKYDSRSTGDCTYNKECTPSGNVAIEVAEKTRSNNLNWVDSGIYRLDNSWLYIIGNYHQVWVFAKKDLIGLHKSNKYKTVKTLPTMKSMLLPIAVADKYCAKKLIFNTLQS
jgi:hypothetical protein